MRAYLSERRGLFCPSAEIRTRVPSARYGHISRTLKLWPARSWDWCVLLGPLPAPGELVSPKRQYPLSPQIAISQIAIRHEGLFPGSDGARLGAAWRGMASWALLTRRGHDDTSPDVACRTARRRSSRRRSFSRLLRLAPVHRVALAQSWLRAG